MNALGPQLLSLLLVAPTFHLLPPSLAAASSTSKAPAPAPGAADFIRSVCNKTGYPDLCYSSISPYANVIKQSLAALSLAGVAVAHSVVRSVATDISGLSDEAKGGTTGAISDCISTLGDAADQINDSLGQLRQVAAGKGGDFKFAMDSVLTAMSAAMTNEDTCMDEVEDEPEGPVKKKVVDRVMEANKFTSIALTFVNYYAKNGSH